MLNAFLGIKSDDVSEKFQAVETALEDLKSFISPTHTPSPTPPAPTPSVANSSSYEMAEKFSWQRIPIEALLRHVSYPGLTAKGISEKLYRDGILDISHEDVWKRISELPRLYHTPVEKVPLDVDGRERTFYYIKS